MVFSLLMKLATVFPILLACSSQTSGSDTPDAKVEIDIDAQVACTEEPCLDLPLMGFQVRSTGTEIAAGQDVEYCEIAQLPGDASDTYYVTGFETKMTSGSHHLIVAAVEAGNEAGLTIGQRYNCVGPSLPGGGDALIAVTGAQQPYSREDYPAGIGRVYTGGQFLVMNYHYLNASEAAIEARSAVNFHLGGEEDIAHIAGSIGFYNFLINTPAGQSGSFTKSCTFDKDAMVFQLTRHTHQWGTDFPVRYKGGSKDGELIYTSPNYEDADHSFDEPVLIKAGEGFEWTCNYQNTTDSSLRFGVTASDEMCILFGQIYDPETLMPTDQNCN